MGSGLWSWYWTKDCRFVSNRSMSSDTSWGKYGITVKSNALLSLLYKRDDAGVRACFGSWVSMDSVYQTRWKRTSWNEINTMMTKESNPRPILRTGAPPPYVSGMTQKCRFWIRWNNCKAQILRFSQNDKKKNRPHLFPLLKGEEIYTPLRPS